MALQRLFVGTFLFVTACAPEEDTDPAPPIGPRLEVLATIVSKEGDRITGAIGAADCRVLLVDANAGALVEVDSIGRVLRRIRVVDEPDGETIMRVEPGAGAQVLVWADRARLLETVDLPHGRVAPIVVPADAWGLHMPGPSARLAGGFFALARLGDGSWPRAEPATRATAHRVDIIDSLGHRVQSLGPIRSAGGRYLTWLSSASALGAAGDTLVVVDLNLARFYRYARPSVNGAFVAVDTIELPRYFEAPRPEETARRSPELQGELVWEFRAQRHLEAADIDSVGRVYVIRNRKRSSRDSRLPPEQALEVYGTRGQTLGSFGLTMTRVRFVKVDGSGRILLRGVDGNSTVIHIVRDSFRQAACAASRYDVVLQ